MLGWYAAAGGTADLHGLVLLVVWNAAADIKNDLTHFSTHGNFHKAGA